MEIEVGLNRFLSVYCKENTKMFVLAPGYLIVVESTRKDGPRFPIYTNLQFTLRTLFWQAHLLTQNHY